MAGRWVVKVDRVGVQDIGAVGCRRVDSLIDLSGIERCVVVIADCDGYGVVGWWLETPPPTHEVLREGCLCGRGKVKASSSGAASVRSAAAASAARGGGVGVIVAVVGGGHVCCCCECV